MQTKQKKIQEIKIVHTRKFQKMAIESSNRSCLKGFKLFKLKILRERERESLGSQHLNQGARNHIHTLYDRENSTRHERQIHEPRLQTEYVAASCMQ